MPHTPLSPNSSSLQPSTHPSTHSVIQLPNPPSHNPTTPATQPTIQTTIHPSTYLTISHLMTIPPSTHPLNSYTKAPTHHSSEHTSVNSSCLHIHVSNYPAFCPSLSIQPSPYTSNHSPPSLLLHLLTYPSTNQFTRPSTVLPTFLQPPSTHPPNPPPVHLSLLPSAHTCHQSHLRSYNQLCLYHSPTHPFTPVKDTRMAKVLSFPSKSLTVQEPSALESPTSGSQNHRVLASQRISKFLPPSRPIWQPSVQYDSHKPHGATEHLKQG